MNTFDKRINITLMKGESSLDLAFTTLRNREEMYAVLSRVPIVIWINGKHLEAFGYSKSHVFDFQKTFPLFKMVCIRSSMARVSLLKSIYTSPSRTQYTMLSGSKNVINSMVFLNILKTIRFYNTVIISVIPKINTFAFSRFPRSACKPSNSKETSSANNWKIPA